MHASRHLTRTEEWIITLCSLLFLGGLYVDGWAHNHIVDTLESFFTPWHAMFYGGFALTAIALLATWIRRKHPKNTWNDAMPAGQGWSLLGIALFALGGLGDMAWHELFGIEESVEALLSPTHLLLGAGFTLMMTGGLRSWWLRQPAPATLLGQLPMILSLTFAFSLLTFLSQFAHYITLSPTVTQPQDMAVLDLRQSRDVAGFLLQSILLTGFVLMVARRSKPAFGMLTALLTLNVAAMAFMRDGQILIPAAFLVGFAGDLLLMRLWPLHEAPRRLRLFAFALPALLFAGYFATIHLTHGTWWSIHMWAGSIVMAGFAGYLLSFVAEPMASER